ncbi:MAG: hypothetical protein KIS77_10005 [Saprospiraceae bacterium]|nr:hypothetical protein [Saprospiraceae bacterium]
MKKLIFGNLLAIALTPIFAQPVSKTDVQALLRELPAPPTTVAEAYDRAYPKGATKPNAIQHYQQWTGKVERAGSEVQNLMADFYRKYPTGTRPVAQPVATASPQQQASMDAATTELAQKMLSDPAFAQKFMQMSEQEQHAYIAKLLADKGIKPASGTPNTNTAAIAGTDVEWIALCNDYTSAATDMSRLEAQAALQQKYQAQHDEVRAWTEAEIKKLPLYSFGEYGRDHDPEQVKAVRKQGLAKHREVAEALLKEALPMFAQLRQALEQRTAPLNNALKSVQYGASYDFGHFYTTVLGTQAMILGELDALLKNEVGIINEVAQWEYDWRNFK